MHTYFKTVYLTLLFSLLGCERNSHHLKQDWYKISKDIFIKENTERKLSNTI